MYLELAARLAVHPAVSAVHYPGLGGTDPRGVLGRELRGPGSTLAFELAGDGEGDVAALFGALQRITPAVSLGSTDTLIQHPASLTHRVVDDAVRVAHGITPRLLRLSVGVEDVEDIWWDLTHGLSVCAVAADPPLGEAPAAVRLSG